MRNLLSHRPTLFLTLLASVAMAKDREPVERTLILSKHPRDEAPSVYVGGRVVTALRFEQPCDAARTKMLGWEGLFEPLVVGGKTVVLYPLRDLTPEDRFPLLVTLADGTELRFTVTAHRQTYAEREVDQQVNVFADRDGYDAVLSSLYASLKRERVLSEENERYRKEENSVDHALAALLSNGAVKQTPFVQDHKWYLKDGDVEMLVQVFRGDKKAAVTFHVTNKSPETPWRPREARLVAVKSGEPRPFALRMGRVEISPGASGTVAVVADGSAFASEKGLVDLNLELVRYDGLAQAVVLLDHRLIRE